MYVAGMDIGSNQVRAVVSTVKGEILGRFMLPASGNYRLAADKALNEALGQAGIGMSDLSFIAGTGFGSKNVPYISQKITEISCQGRGVNKEFPSARTIIDIGGQATNVTKVDSNGRALDFVVSEKCAAGSGRFLQVIAHVLNLPLSEIGPLSMQSKNPIEFTTNCAVFAESETISRVAEGTLSEDILAGMHRAVANKISNLVIRIGLQEDCVITGGGAKDIGLVKALEEKLGVKMYIPNDPQLTGALGAAVIAAELASVAGVTKEAVCR